MALQEDEPAEDVDVGAERAELTQLADEYSKMDAEDVVGGVRTRFRYREVPSLSAPVADSHCPAMTLLNFSDCHVSDSSWLSLSAFCCRIA